jgi:hypothetical protein
LAEICEGTGVVGNAVILNWPRSRGRSGHASRESGSLKNTENDSGRSLNIERCGSRRSARKSRFPSVAGYQSDAAFASKGRRNFAVSLPDTLLTNWWRLQGSSEIPYPEGQPDRLRRVPQAFTKWPKPVQSPGFVLNAPLSSVISR